MSRRLAPVPSHEWDGVQERLQRLADLARSAGVSHVVLRKQASISWLLGVRSHVPNTLDATCFDLVLDVEAGVLTVMVNAIEAPRLRATELAGLDVEYRIVPWTEDRAARLPSGDGVGTDNDAPGTTGMSGSIAELCRRLDQYQQSALRAVCADAAAAATEVAHQFDREDREYEVAGRFSKALLERGLDPIVLMVAGADRMARDRHPIPTTASMGARGMIVCCARRSGLVASVTRLVSFGEVTAEERSGYHALLEVERVLLDHSVPGARLGEVLQRGCEAYGAAGLDLEEWTRHHQGGYSGWHSREFPARPSSPEVLAAGQVVAWNPSGAGWKVEDTALITSQGPELLVDDGAWPMLDVGRRRRPDILER